MLLDDSWRGWGRRRGPDDGFCVIARSGGRHGDVDVYIFRPVAPVPGEQD